MTTRFLQVSEVPAGEQSPREPSIRETLCNLLKDKTLWDVTLRGDDGVEVKAHRCILAGRSSVFQSLLQEANTDSPTVDLPFAGSVVAAIVEYIYTDKVKLANEEPENGDASIHHDEWLPLADAAEHFKLVGLANCIEKEVETVSLINMENEWGCDFVTVLVPKEQEEDSEVPDVDCLEQNILSSIPGFKLRTLPSNGAEANKNAVGAALGSMDFSRCLFAAGFSVSGGGDGYFDKLSSCGPDPKNVFHVPQSPHWCDSICQQQTVPFPYHLPNPQAQGSDIADLEKLEDQCLEALEAKILVSAFHGHVYKAILIEYVLAGCGAELTHRFLNGLGELLKKHKIVVVANEIMTGGRVGPTVAMTSSVPISFQSCVQFITLGNIISAGMVLERIPEQATHPSSHSLNPTETTTSKFARIVELMELGALRKRRAQVLNLLGCAEDDPSCWGPGLMIFSSKFRTVEKGLRARYLSQLEDVKIWPKNFSFSETGYNRMSINKMLMERIGEWIAFLHQQDEAKHPFLQTLALLDLNSEPGRTINSEDLIEAMGQEKAEEIAKQLNRRCKTKETPKSLAEADLRSASEHVPERWSEVKFQDEVTSFVFQPDPRPKTEGGRLVTAFDQEVTASKKEKQSSTQEGKKLSSKQEEKQSSSNKRGKKQRSSHKLEVKQSGSKQEEKLTSKQEAEEKQGSSKKGKKQSSKQEAKESGSKQESDEKAPNEKPAARWRPQKGKKEVERVVLGRRNKEEHPDSYSEFAVTKFNTTGSPKRSQEGDPTAAGRKRRGRGKRGQSQETPSPSEEDVLNKADKKDDLCGKQSTRRSKQGKKQSAAKQEGKPSNSKQAEKHQRGTQQKGKRKKTAANSSAPSRKRAKAPTAIIPVWVTDGKTEHMALLLEETKDGRRRIQWTATDKIVWIAAGVPVRKDLGGRSRRSRQGH